MNIFELATFTTFVLVAVYAAAFLAGAFEVPLWVATIITVSGLVGGLGIIGSVWRRASRPPRTGRKFKAELEKLDVARVQDWAVSVLDDPPSPEVGHRHATQLRQDELPPDILALAQTHHMSVCFVGPQRDSNSSHVVFTGLENWELLVGRPSFRPGEFYNHKQELAPGVWWVA